MLCFRNQQEVVFSSRKRGKENSFDGQLGSQVTKSPGKKAKRVNGELNVNGDDSEHAETSSSTHKEIMLPPGTDLTSVSGIDMPAEDVGNALEFLEFCSVFVEASDLDYMLVDDGY